MQESELMMYAFEIVTIAVALVAIALCFTRYFRVGAVLADLGRQGSMWFQHQDDGPVRDCDPADAVESPIPRRPLRARY
jgi:hypothetical protein